MFNVNRRNDRKFSHREHDDNTECSTDNNENDDVNHCLEYKADKIVDGDFFTNLCGCIFQKIQHGTRVILHKRLVEQAPVVFNRVWPELAAFADFLQEQAETQGE